MSYVFQPYTGLSDLRFGASREEVEALMGTPKSIRTTYTGATRIEYGFDHPALVFADEALIELNMLPVLSGGLTFEGLDLFGADERDVVRLLTAHDDTAYDRNGFLIFARLGIALTGFDPPDEDQKAITVFGPKHVWSGKA